MQEPTHIRYCEILFTSETLRIWSISWECWGIVCGWSFRGIALERCVAEAEMELYEDWNTGKWGWREKIPARWEWLDGVMTHKENEGKMQKVDIRPHLTSLNPGYTEAFEKAIDVTWGKERDRWASLTAASL